MSSINTPTTYNNSPFIYKTPSEAFVAGRWGKPSEKPAEKQQNFAGSDKQANQLAAKSLLDLVNTTDIEVLKVALPNDPITDATMEAVITSPHPVNHVKRLNKKKDKTANKNINIDDYCRVVSINGISPVDIFVNQIRLFGYQNRINRLWRASKKKCFDMIADNKDNPKKKPAEKKTTPTTVNQKQYFNVIFSNEI